MKSFLKKAAFLVIVWGIVLGSINFLCSLIVKNTYVNIDGISEETKDQSYGYFMPNQDKRLLFPGVEPYQVKTNTLGFRSVGVGHDWQLEDLKDKYRILSVGDSITFGLFVDDEDSYPYRLQSILTKNNKNAFVMNAGIGSTSITDHLYYVKTKGLDVKPNLVIINFCSNDLDEMKYDEPFYERLKRDNEFSVGEQIQNLSVMRIFRKFQIEHKFNRWMKKMDDQKAAQMIINRSQNIEDALYVSSVQGGLVVNDPFNVELKERWSKYFVNVLELNSLLEAQGINFLYIIFPDVATVYNRIERPYQDILIPFLEENGIEYIDLRPVFSSYQNRIFEIYNDLPRDFHLGGFGNQLLAQDIHTRIRDRIR